MRQLMHTLLMVMEVHDKVSVRGKSLTVVQKKLLNTVQLDPSDYLYVRMGPDQQGLIFVNKSTGDKIHIINSPDTGRPIVKEV